MTEPKVIRVDLPLRRVALIAPGVERFLDPAFRPPPIEVIRPDDLVHLRFSFINLRITSGRRDEAPVLVRRNRRRRAFLVVEMPSQHITERAFFETVEHLKIKDPPQQIAGLPVVPPDPDAAKGSEALLPPPVFASISGPSRLVFNVGAHTVPYTLDGLLAAIGRLDLNVAPHATPPAFARLPPFGALVGTRIDIGPIFAVAGSAARTSRVRRQTLTERPSVAAQLTALGRVRRATADLEYRLGADAALRAFSTTRLGLAVDARSVVADLLGEILFERLPPLPAPPKATETALELPWRLILSPNFHAAFAHSVDAVGHDGRIELWHSRLGLRAVDNRGNPALDPEGHPFVDERRSDYRTVRAIWARDFDVLPTLFPASTYEKFKFTSPPASENFPAAGGTQDWPQVRMALNSRDRMMLVHETSNFHLVRHGTSQWTPPAVPTNRLMLSTLGGWLDSKVQMRTLPDGGVTIQEWKHRAALGRDHEVRVVYAGFLLPFGHRAALVKVTERRFAHGPKGPTAYLFQRMYIVVQEPSKTFRQDTHAIAPGDPRRLDLVMPFASVTLLTRATPMLDPPQDLLGGAGGFVFVPRVAGADLPFKIMTVDLEGHVAEFSAPLVFMERDHNVQAGTLPQVLAAYNGSGTPANRVERAFNLRGQRVAYAPSQATDDTTLATDTVAFQVVAPPHLAGIPQDEPRFVPILDEAKAVVPAMSALAGAASPIRLRYPAHYAAQGYAGNAAQVFLEAADPPMLTFAGQGDRSGGFVTPSLQVTGLSRLTGPIGGNIADAVAGGTFDVKSFFDASGAKLFGLIPLSDLLSGIGFSPDKVPAFVAQTLDVATTLKQNVERLQTAAQQEVAAIGAAATQLETDAQALFDDLVALAKDPGNPPDLGTDLGKIAADLAPFIAAVEGAPALPEAQKRQLVAVAKRVQDQLEDAATVATAVQALVQFANGLKLPDVITARLDWSTPLDPWPSGSKAIFQPTEANGDDAAKGKLRLAVDIQAPTQPGKKPNVLVACSISPFDLNLIAPITTFLRLRFATMEFSIEPGKKADVNVKFRKDGGIVFAGPLSFINTLKDIIPSDGFSDPPYLDISADGIKAGFDLAIPDLAVGVFALQNIALGAHFKVPFIAESIETAFNFCTRENPFRLSVSLFAGGGFFGITITPKEVRILEAALEFGAAISINLGVASGGVSVMAGIYFRLESGDATLTGYFRLRGEVDVLGLISASLELYLGLSYETATGKAVGRATLTIEVHVLFFSASVEVSCEKKFAGANGDPSFVDLMGLQPGAPADAERPWDSYCRAFADE